jgi:predicted phage terminase large subunit-like protein
LIADQGSALRIPSATTIQAEIERRRKKREADNVARDADAIRARCSTLAGFVREAWVHLEPNATFVSNWHIDAICEHLEAVTDGRITRLLINVPPGSSKSMIVSVLWPAWEWGPKGKRSMRYLTTSFNDAAVTRDSIKSRDLMLSDWYRALWPDVVLTRTGEKRLGNSDTGSRVSVAFGSLTGQRGDRFIVDDPHSTEGAESEADRLRAARRFIEGGTNRLNDQMKSALVVIMQRLHADDISGQILKRRMNYVHLMIPMEFEEERRSETAIGWRDPRTYDGELLDPRRFPPEAVTELKGMGSFAWAGQYQQRPTAREGGMFKRAWWAGQIIPRSAVPRTGLTYVRAWDFAATRETPGKSPDWTVGLLMARAGRDYYVFEPVRMRETAGKVQTEVVESAKIDPVGTVIRIPQDPGQAGRAQVDSYVPALAGYAVKPELTSGRGDKAARAMPVAVQVEYGKVYLVNSGDPSEYIDPWIATFLDEVCTFPAGAHDDQVDAFSDAFNELAQGERIPFESASAGPRETTSTVERDSRYQFRDNDDQDEGRGFGSVPSQTQGLAF